MHLAALVISAIGVFWALLATFVIGPNFGKMFADFGGELPMLTRLFLGWAPLVLAVISFVFVAGTTRVSAKWELVPLVTAIVTTLLQPAIFLVAIYLPIFAIAGSIK